MILWKSLAHDSLSREKESIDPTMRAVEFL
jgi:hypothetical protein